ncbi:MAG: class I SAM-dependent methyltransferase, partial [Clostridia bacterium]|nr:class I SAM-dependent methyltransferase [Clostridia bacterium]
IGCDHGQITAELILQAKAYQVIATDISSASINKAVRLASQLNILPFISFREGDGFAPITKYDKIDSAVIAGMGGSEIIKILQESKVRVNELVLQPMTDAVKLRGYLLQIGFKIVQDIVIKEGDNYYTIIKVKTGKMRITDLELYFGMTNIKELSVDFIDYIRIERAKIFKVRDMIGELNKEYKAQVKRIDRVLKMYYEKQKREAE